MSSTGSLGSGQAVQPRPLTLTAISNSKVYDSTMTALAKPLASGFIGSDTISGLAELYTSANVGLGKNLYVDYNATFSGLNNPEAIAIDAQGDVFVDNNGNNTISEFAPAATTPSATLTGVSYPNALIFDRLGNLYAANYYNGTISKFAPGATLPTATLTGVSGPVAFAFDSNNNLYVASYFGTVSVFAPGATSPTLTLTGPSNAEAVAVDGNGNVYVSDPGANTVSVFAAGAATPTRTLTGLNGPYALLLDGGGNLYVSNSGNGTVSEFAPGAITANKLLIGLNRPVSMAFDNQGDLFVANASGTTVGEFYPGAITPSLSYGGLGSPYELALDANNSVFVVNQSDNTVHKFATGVFISDGNGGNNYAVTTVGISNGIITPALLTIVASPNTKAYDSTTTAAAKPIVTGLLGHDSVTTSPEVYQNSSAGTGKTLGFATYTVNDNDGGFDYSVTVTKTIATGAITSAPLTIAASPNTKTYDSTTSAAAIPTVLGLQGADSVTNLSEVYASSNAGKSKALSVTTYLLNDGNGGNNYTVAILPNTAGAITPKPLSITGVTTANRQYDATNVAVINTSNAALAGVIDGDFVALNTTGAAGAFVTKNAGSNIEVDVSGMALGGPQASDYSLTRPTLTSNITQAPLTLTALTNTKTYDATTAAAVAPAVAGVIGPDKIVGLTEAYSNKNAGTAKTLSVNAYTINDGNGGNNYSVTTVANTAGVITKASLVIKAVTNTKSWDGTASAAAIPTVTGLLGGDSVSGLAESYTDINVGTGKTLTVNPGYTASDGNGGKNYTVSTASLNNGVINPPNSKLTLPSSLTVVELPQGSTQTIYLSLTVNLPLNYTVTYETISGTALAGSDFVAANLGTIHVVNTSNTQASVQIPITIRGGAYQQPGGPATKSFSVQLVAAVNNGSGNAFSQSLLNAPNSHDDDHLATSDGSQDQHRQSSERLGRRFRGHHDLLADKSGVQRGTVCASQWRYLFELQHVAQRQAL